MAGGKRDRDGVFLEYTKSICPVCKVVVDAQVNVRDGTVYQPLLTELKDTRRG